MAVIDHSFDIAFIPGQGRDSRIPDGWPSLAGTVLESLAQQCEPGRTIMLGGALPSYVSLWREFHAWHPDPEKSVPNDTDTWGSIGYWDRNWKRSFIYNDRTAAQFSGWNRSVFSSYRAKDHRWIHNPLPDENIGLPHVYSRNAYDDSRGHFYRAPRNDRIHRYSLTTDAWEHFAVAPPAGSFGGQEPITYHEGLDGLLAADDTTGQRRLLLWQGGDSSWTDLGPLGISPYHGLMVFNRTRGDALIIGGGTGRPCRLIDSQGGVHAMPNCDFALVGASSNNLTYDPTTGNYLFREGLRLWELSPESEEWRLQTDWSAAPHSDDWPGNFYGRPFIAIDDLGVLLWQTYYTPRIYKPASVF